MNCFSIFSACGNHVSNSPASGICHSLSSQRGAKLPNNHRVFASHAKQRIASSLSYWKRLWPDAIALPTTNNAVPCHRRRSIPNWRSCSLPDKWSRTLSNCWSCSLSDWRSCSLSDWRCPIFSSLSCSAKHESTII